MVTKPEKWDLETGIVVVGTGGSGLTAAIVAHDNGARVTVVERSDKVGGTTAVSGGLPWVPLNHYLADVGITDSNEEAMTYLRLMAAGRVDDALIEAFVDTAPEMIRYMEEHTTVKFGPSRKQPDYHCELPGGKKTGRTLDVSTFDSKLLGDWRDRLRPAPILMIPVTLGECEEVDALISPLNLNMELIAQRMTQGIVGMGMALIGHLLKACLDRGIEPILVTRARELVIEDGRVIGLRAERFGKDFYIHSRQGVILACGGFEWNEELKAQFLPGPITHPTSPPFNEGDGLKMAMAVGADLGNMSECWGMPSAMVPGEEYEGRQLNRILLGERRAPHSIMVNRYGKRFTDEVASYNDINKAFHILDPVAHDYTNIPAWLIYDQQYRDKHHIMTVMPGEEAPEWLEQADTLEGLAQKVGIDPEGLKATVERFNKFAVEGVDHDFQRGSSLYDQVHGDPGHKPNPCLGTVKKPPFYALSVYPGTLGTSGGPKVNRNGQVLHVKGTPITGLYAAGNVMASVSGPGYGGGGHTIGLGMTWGYISAKHAARQK